MASNFTTYEEVWFKSYLAAIQSRNTNRNVCNSETSQDFEKIANNTLNSFKQTFPKKEDIKDSNKISLVL